MSLSCCGTKSGLESICENILDIILSWISSESPKPKCMWVLIVGKYFHFYFMSETLFCRYQANVECRPNTNHEGDWNHRINPNSW